MRISHQDRYWASIDSGVGVPDPSLDFILNMVVANSAFDRQR